MTKYSFILLFGLGIQNPFAQSSDCNNLDFEMGDSSGWSAVGNIEIVDSNQIDPYGEFPLSLSGAYSMKLGNKTNPVTSSISRPYTVTASNSILVYGYSIVFLGFPHIPSIAAYVNLKIVDSFGDTIPCANYSAYAQSTAGNGFFQSTAPNEANLTNQCCYPVFYKPWEIRLVDLSPYIGQTVTLNLSSDWCFFDVDWGYAYVDFYCTSNLFSEFYSCANNMYNIATIPGLATYTWSGPSIISGQGTNQIQVDQAGVYTLNSPAPNAQCPEIEVPFTANLDEIPDIPIADFELPTMICIVDSAHFENLSHSISEITEITWSFGDNSFDSIYSPVHHYNSIGTYPILLTITNQEGCSDSIEQFIDIVPPPVVDLGPDLKPCMGEIIEISYTPIDNETFLEWSTGSNENSIHVSESNEIVLSVSHGCTVTDTVLVNFQNYGILKCPNVFTPNSDQVNDFLEFSHSGITYYSITIQNRWGNVIFKSDNPNISWDGTYNNELADEGVYFYLINYQTECLDEIQIEHGHCTLIQSK